MEQEKEYHILSLSGGKDSTALAFYIKENMPEIHEKIEYVFCDTGCDLPETYDYLNKIEVYLNKKITRIKPEKSFEHLINCNGYLPTQYNRWCTFELKTKTFNKYIFDKLKNSKKQLVNLYIGIRADESHRATNDKSVGEHIKASFPFVEKGLIKKDIENILTKAGIGFPDYYNWRSRSGCYFCFYQKKIEWIGLYENHPKLFQKAMNYEYYNNDKIKKGYFYWIKDLSLKKLIEPENRKKIKEKYSMTKKLENTDLSSSLITIFS